ncbi:MAG TPA: hypothetical protein VLA50_04390 [Erythrobacter sp.]|nr:hypothetical protein [Erythrobacter sp.]
MKQVLTAAAVIAFAAAVPASAQQPGQSHETPPTDGASKTALAQTVAGSPEALRPLAKLRAPLCLAVAATDEAFARTVAKRIIANAKAAGVRTRREGCTANALVTFSDNARGQIEAYRTEGRKLVKRMSHAEIDAALDVRDPAYVFQPTEATPRIGEGDEIFFTGTSSSWTNERSFRRTPQDMLTTLVMVEADAVAGMNPVQVADYVTLRLLAPTGEIAADSAVASQTILSLFAAPSEAPPELTKADRAYLKSLYKLPRTAYAKEVLEETERVAAK